MCVNGSTTTYYIWGATGLEYEITGSTTKTYHADHLGSTMLLTNDAGTATGEWFEYDSYGNPTHVAGTPTTPFRWHGTLGVTTEANGLIHMRARFYHPRIMRFLNQDPIGFEGGMNWHAFADGDPISINDPLGLCGTTVASSAWINSNTSLYSYQPITLDLTGQSLPLPCFPKQDSWSSPGGIGLGISISYGGTDSTLGFGTFSYAPNSFTITDSGWRSFSTLGKNQSSALALQMAALNTAIRNPGAAILADSFSLPVDKQFRVVTTRADKYEWIGTLVFTIEGLKYKNARIGKLIEKQSLISVDFTTRFTFGTTTPISPAMTSTYWGQPARAKDGAPWPYEQSVTYPFVQRPVAPPQE
jgi:RHS repeat-associated protein